MQTRIGYGLSLVAVALAVLVCWTSKLTGWFNPQNPPEYLWVIGGLAVALGVIRLYDRRKWSLRHKAIVAKRRTALRAACAAYERWREAFVAMLNEPITAPVDPEPLAEQPQAAAV